MSTRNAIFLSINYNYYRVTLSFLNVLCRNYKDHPDILLFYSNVPENCLAVLKNYPRVKIYDLNRCNILTGPKMRQHPGHDARVVYSRFLIWTDRFNEYDKILHLDVDVLVLKPLDELFERDEFTIFPDSYGGKDKIFNDHSNPNLLKLLEEDQLIIPEIAANAGVFVVPRRYRTKACYENLLYWLNRYQPYLVWADQSVINLWLLKNEIAIVRDNRFNYQIRLFREEWQFGRMKGVGIIHFNGFYKTGLLNFMMRLASICFSVPLAKPFYYFFLEIFFKTYYSLVSKTR